MSFLAALALHSLVALSPQGDPPAAGQKPEAGATAKLPAAEQATLRDRLMKYIEADEAYDRASGLKDRERTGKAREKAREQFDKEWEKHEKKGLNLMGSMADLRAVFDNCFTIKALATSPGTLREETTKDKEARKYSFFVPKGYKPDKPTRVVVVMPGTTDPAATSGWARPADYFGQTWDKTNALNDTVFHVVHAPSELEFDPVPDFTREADERNEDERTRAVFLPLGSTMGAVNVDRSRFFLDCGRGNCGYGVRLATMFPNRFAGLILRQPVAVEDVRLGSLTGMQVFLVKTAATAAAVDALKASLEAVSPGMVTVHEATDEYPHKAAAPAIEAWMGNVRRNLVQPRVVIEPNHDRFNKAYWVDMDRVDPLATSAPDSKPRIEVVADRSANRITVTAVGVESFVLLLNDDLVDLDKEFTVVVNEKAVTEKRTRSFSGLWDRLIQQRDWDYLFPVAFTCSVPKK